MEQLPPKGPLAAVSTSSIISPVCKTGGRDLTWCPQPASCPGSQLSLWAVGMCQESVHGEWELPGGFFKWLNLLPKDGAWTEVRAGVTGPCSIQAACYARSGVRNKPCGSCIMDTRLSGSSRPTSRSNMVTYKTISGGLMAGKLKPRGH